MPVGLTSRHVSHCKRSFAKKIATDTVQVALAGDGVETAAVTAPTERNVATYTSSLDRKSLQPLIAGPQHRFDR